MGGTSRTTRRRSGSPPTPQPELFSLEEEPSGGLPAPLSEVAGRQEKVVRHFVELAPLVQILDLPVPQMVDYPGGRLTDPGIPACLSRLSKCPRSLAHHVHHVLLFLSRSQREQLVEVPTVLSPLRIRGADRRHSSSSWSWSRFSPRDRVHQRLANAFLSELWSRSSIFCRADR